jgi:hypothetical protein
MELKYIGPKAEISSSSISFNTCKEDKFLYISTAYQLLKSLEHDYERNKPYIDTLSATDISEDTLKKLITSACPNLETCVQEHQDVLLTLFDREIQQVKKSVCMDPISKEVYLKNHALMKEYRLQRQINKSVYYMLIEKLAYGVRTKRIAYIITPLHEKFTYVLINLQKALLQDKTPLFSELEVYQDKNELKTRLRLSQI